MRSTRVSAITASICLVSSALAGGGDDARTPPPIPAWPVATAPDAGDPPAAPEGQEPPEPCIVTCPDGSIAEGEDTGGACDQTVSTNGGCAMSPFAILTVACGDTICGIAWADAGIRDTDWFRLPAQGTLTQITFTVTGEFDGSYFYLGEGVDCATTFAVINASPLGCETGTITVAVEDETWWFAATAAFEDVPCGIEPPFGNHYVVNWTCLLPPFPCPPLGDTNGDGAVDFDDLLVVLANFGPCP